MEYIRLAKLRMGKKIKDMWYMRTLSITGELIISNICSDFSESQSNTIALETIE